MNAPCEPLKYRLDLQFVTRTLLAVVALVMAGSIERAYAHGKEGIATEDTQLVAPVRDSFALNFHNSHDFATASDHHKDEDGQTAHKGHQGDASSHHYADKAKASESHDHSAHEGWAKNGFERFLAWLGKFHPALTNFPIALLVAAALAELLSVITGNGNNHFRQAARYCATLGGFTALVTVGLGWFYSGFSFASDDSVLAVHRWNGTAIGVLAAGLAILAVADQQRSSRRWRSTFRGVLCIVTIMVAVNGYLGGRMLYGADHYDWPAHKHDEADQHGDH